MRKTGLLHQLHVIQGRKWSMAAALLSSLAMLSARGAAAAQAASPPVPTVQTWELPAGPLEVALKRAALQAPLTISYSPELVAGRTTRGVSGEHTVAQALQMLLAGTGLESDSVDENSFALKVASRSDGPRSERASPRATETTPREAKPTVAQIEEVSVTGTRIRGAKPSSPLVIISQEEMRLAGHSTLGEVVRALPQNFSGGQNPGVSFLGAGGGDANTNITGASSLNLRGLGPDATVTLLNGARLPYDGFSQATDVAVIPVAAIDRMEVLLDGSSALYGSDAVGGVANIVLKRDYEGAELTARYGESTAGGNEQTQLSALVGSTWSTGSVLVAAETMHGSRVLASDRDYLEYIPYPELLSVLPQISQNGVLLSGHQNFGSAVELALDGFYTKREMKNQFLTTATLWSPSYTETEIYGVSPSLRVSLPHDWSMKVHGFKGEDSSSARLSNIFIDTGALLSESDTEHLNQIESVAMEFEGVVMPMPAGDLRASFGGGWRKVDFARSNPVTGVIAAAGSAQSRFAFGEMDVPVVAEASEVPLVERLSLNAAVRYEHYDTFGSTTTTKIGIVWRVMPSLDLRANWGESFKAPTLFQSRPSQVTLNSAASRGITDAPAGATVLTRLGGNPDLEPETAEVMTAGLTFRPLFLPGASIEIGWFDINYTQRVVTPFVTSAQFWGALLQDPAYADFIVVDPTEAQQSQLIQSADRFDDFSGVPGGYDPSSVVAIFDNRNVNAASQVVRGIDLDIRYTVPMFDASLFLGAGASYITDSSRRLSTQRAESRTAGVVAFPPKLKARLSVAYARGAFTSTVAANYLGGVDNTRRAPPAEGSSMTTVDLVLDYSARTEVFGGIGVSLSVANALNERPPYIEPSLPYYINYDSTNYSPIGRFVSLSVTKKF
jgi:iron complex outermembrane receptor protein